MRYGVLSDIHANLPALEVALGVLGRDGADRYVCCGDLVGYGPHPNECVELMATIGARCVAGNHDLMVLGRVGDRDCIPLARRSLRWTRSVLSERSRSYLDGLPARMAVESDVVVAHGSWDDPLEYVTREDQVAEQFRRMGAARPSARLLVLGHTHRPMAYGHSAGALPLEVSRPVGLAPTDRYVLNPGSVGQSREALPRVSFMLIDLRAQEVTPYAEPYDVDAVISALRRQRLPARSVHLNPAAWSTRAEGYALSLRELSRRPSSRRR